MSDHIRVEGHSYLMRDGQSGAIINTNVNEMTQARVRKAQWKKQQNEIKELKSESVSYTHLTLPTNREV